MGSFANVLIDRLPHDQSINGRSHCDYCGKKLGIFDLVPILSFIVLRGKSRCCNRSLSWQYPLIEFVTGILFVVTYIILMTNQEITNVNAVEIIKLIIWLGVADCLLVIFVADVKYQIIPDEMQIVLGSLSLVLQLLISPTVYTAAMSLVAGGVVMLPILAIYLFTKGKGMGFGDVKLAISMGILLGIKGGLLGLYLAFIVGAIVGLILIMGKKLKIKSKIAFGPFLVIGTIGVLIWGHQLKDIIYRLYGI
jgi:prepilin signal peptidase PulO-like enzyme (type II secretory pathway)